MSRQPFVRTRIGRRTGVDVLAGKKITKNAFGFDNFADYFTESEEDESFSVELRKMSQKKVMNNVQNTLTVPKPVQCMSPFVPSSCETNTSDDRSSPTVPANETETVDSTTTSELNHAGEKWGSITRLKSVSSVTDREAASSHGGGDDGDDTAKGFQTKKRLTYGGDTSLRSYGRKSSSSNVVNGDVFAVPQVPKIARRRSSRAVGRRSTATESDVAVIENDKTDTSLASTRTSARLRDRSTGAKTENSSPKVTLSRSVGSVVGSGKGSSQCETADSGGPLDEDSHLWGVQAGNTSAAAAGNRKRSRSDTVACGSVKASRKSSRMSASVVDGVSTETRTENFRKSTNSESLVSGVHDEVMTQGQSANNVTMESDQVGDKVDGEQISAAVEETEEKTEDADGKDDKDHSKHVQTANANTGGKQSKGSKGSSGGWTDLLLSESSDDETDGHISKDRSQDVRLSSDPTVAESVERHESRLAADDEIEDDFEVVESEFLVFAKQASDRTEKTRLSLKRTHATDTEALSPSAMASSTAEGNVSVQTQKEFPQSRPTRRRTASARLGPLSSRSRKASKKSFNTSLSSKSLRVAMLKREAKRRSKAEASRSHQDDMPVLASTRPVTMLSSSSPEDSCHEETQHGNVSAEASRSHQDDIPVLASTRPVTMLSSSPGDSCHEETQHGNVSALSARSKSTTPTRNTTAKKRAGRKKSKSTGRTVSETTQHSDSNISVQSAQSKSVSSTTRRRTSSMDSKTSRRKSTAAKASSNKADVVAKKRRSRKSTSLPVITISPGADGAEKTYSEKAMDAAESYLDADALPSMSTSGNRRQSQDAEVMDNATSKKKKKKNSHESHMQSRRLTENAFLAAEPSPIPTMAGRWHKRQDRRLTAHSMLAASSQLSLDATPKSILKRRRPASDSELPSCSNTPLHYFQVTCSSDRRRNSHSPRPAKTVQIILPEPIDENGPRRSQRTRVRPLDWFRNERIRYEPRKSGGFMVAGIISPSQPDNPKGMYRKKKKARQWRRGRTAARPRTPRNLSLHTSVPQSLEMANTTQIAVMSDGLETHMECFKTRESLHFCDPQGNDAAENDPLILCKAFKQKAFSLGQLVLRPLEQKGTQFVRKDTMVFIIKQGKIAVTIHQSTAILQTEDMFFVPPGNTYNIKNMRDEDAHLYFFQSKGTE